MLLTINSIRSALLIKARVMIALIDLSQYRITYEKHLKLVRETYNHQEDTESSLISYYSFKTKYK